MAKLIKSIHDLVDIAIDKNLTNYRSRSEIDTCVYAGLVEVFRDIVKEYAKTLQIRNYMVPFQKVASITLTAGIGDLPSDLEHEIEFYLNVTGKTHIDMIERGFWSARREDPVDPPSTSRPIGTVYKDTTRKLEIAPITGIATAKVLYFATPTKPTYATTISSGQDVYDDTASVDVQASVLLHDIIVDKSLAILGLGLSRGELVRKADTSQQKEFKL